MVLAWVFGAKSELRSASEAFKSSMRKWMVYGYKPIILHTQLGLILSIAENTDYLFLFLTNIQIHSTSQKNLNEYPNIFSKPEKFE